MFRSLMIWSGFPYLSVMLDCWNRLSRLRALVDWMVDWMGVASLVRGLISRRRAFMVDTRSLSGSFVQWGRWSDVDVGS